MKYTIATFLLLSSLLEASNIEISTLKMSSDLEMLVNLSGSLDNTIDGIDQNNNGVRDDVEYYIENKYAKKPFEKKTFFKAAKTIQEIITLPQDASAKVHQKLDQKLLNLYTCRDYILYKIESADLEKEMQEKIIFKAKVLNTKKRLNAYMEHKKRLPFEFDDLDDKTLAHEKNICLKSYQKSQKSDTSLLSSTK